MFFLVKAVIVLIFSVNIVRSITPREFEQSTLKKLFENYDPAIRPSGENGTDGPVKITVNTFIRSISNVDELKMTYDAQLTFRQEWTDDRLIYHKMKLDYLTVTQPEKLWIPDLFFSNEQEGHFHKIIKPNTLLRIYPNGRILFSTRISLRLSFQMDVRNYPMDSQIFSIIMASYGYTTDDIDFIWKQMSPVQITKTLNLPKFTLKTFYVDTCNSRTNTGEYSCLKLNMQFSRNLFYYIESSYMPTAALVIFSWVVFWLNPKSSTIRLGIWIAMLISITIVNTSMISKGPDVSYTKAIDIWLGMCSCFIFCVLLELCLVENSISKNETYGIQNDVEETTADKNLIIAEESSKLGQVLRNLSGPYRRFKRYPTRAEKIDSVSRILFPAAFVVFNFIYWITYCVKRD